jgi:4-amino-4-deoxy-L-arabinose transferase-like glycosyltransferase
VTISTPTQTELIARQSLSERLRIQLQGRAATYTRFFALLAIGLMIYGSYKLTQFSDNHFPTEGVSYLLIGVVAMGAAIALSRYGEPKPMPAPMTEETLQPPSAEIKVRWAVVATLLGIVLLAVVSEINGRALNLPIFRSVTTHVQAILFFSGVLLVGWGLAGAPSPLRLRHFLRGIGRGEFLLVFGILALALLLRGIHLDTAVRQLIDELHWADAIRRIGWEHDLRLLTQMSGQGPYTWIYPYWEASFVSIFGHNLVGLRFVSAVIGMFTVLATYGIARALFDRRVALLAGVLIAVFPGHVHFSRIAMTLIGDPLFGTLIVMFMARAWTTNRRIDWVGAGVALGMTQYFYEGGRLLYPPLALTWIVLMFLLDRKPLLQRIRAQRTGILMMIVAGVLIAAPAYYTIAAGAGPLAGRMNDSGLGIRYYQELFADGLTTTELRTTLERWSYPFMLYIHRPEIGGMYLGGDQPLVLEVLVPVFMLGVAHSIWRWRHPSVIIIVWVMATAVGNALFIRDNIVSPRYVVVMPALAILLALGVRYTLPMILPANRSRLHRWLPVGLVGAMAVFQIWYYWNPYLERFNAQVRNFKGYGDGVDVALRAAELPPETQTIIVGYPVHDQNVPRDMLGFLLNPDIYPLLSMSPDAITPKYLISLPRDRNYAFFVEVEDMSVVDLIYRYFPNVEAPQYTTTDMTPRKAYVLLFAPASLYDLYRPVKAQP